MNRDLLKVARILTVISAIILCVTIVGILFGILNFIAANKIKRVEDGLDAPDSLFGWAIYLIVFGFLISGVLVLLAVSSNGTSFSSSTNNIEDKLTSLNALFDKGLISKEEYEERRKNILNSDL